MPAFQAINLEPEENIDEQIDTTKELHVDEALKRFQNALKLHAEGPRSREAAHAAYEKLFESEVFKYREAQTDFDRIERQANGTVEPADLEPFSTGLDIDAGGADGVAASLSLALYLGYKNYGEFFLDKLKDRRNSDPEWKLKSRISYHNDEANKVLDNWARALDQDPSDPEVWRRAARFASALGSGRLQRFCLEAAIELDDDPTVVDVEPPSLAEGLAGEQLKDRLRLLEDDIALSHPIMAPWIKKHMPVLIKRHLDPIPFLPNPTQTLTPPSSPPRLNVLDEADTAAADNEDTEDEEESAISTWPDLGQELMRHIEDTKAAIGICEAVLRLAKASGDLESQRKQDTSPDGTQPIEDGTKDVTMGDKAKNAESGKKESEEVPETTKAEAKPAAERSQSVASTRKRSQSAAGLPEAVDEEVTAEKRSKRVRRRETMNTEEVVDPSTVIANQLQPYIEADHNLFQRAQNVLENLGVEDKDTINRLVEIQETSTPEDRASKLSPLATRDLRGVVAHYREAAARALLNKKEQATLSLSSFLEHTKSGSQEETKTILFDEVKGLGAFTEKVDQHKSWMTGGDIAFEWVRSISESYAKEKWSDKMKIAVVQMLNRSDSDLFVRISNELEYFGGSQERLEDLKTVIPMLFELHVDIYERITNPSSVVDYATRTETKDRLGRWLDVASSYIQLLDLPRDDPISVRFLWASVMVSSLSDDPVREHILQMWTSLRDFLTEHNVETIQLPNNVVMPTVSPAAADREISKLTTMDFFIGLFQEEELKNPVHVIETLEPVLNPSSVVVQPQRSTSATSDQDEEGEDQPEGNPISECAGQGLRDLWKFLLGSSTELRLFLWSRLGDAYQAIDYPTKRFSCLLKSIEMVVADLQGETYTKTPDESRALLLMRTLKSLDELIIHALTMALNNNEAFEIIDDEHIKSSASAVAKVNCLLHVVALCEDEVRVGIATAPSNSSTYQSLLQRLREMQVRAWCLQYSLIKAGISQQDSFLSPDKELADYLAAIHQVIGLRKFCKVSNKIFVKMMRAEILKLQTLENWEDYLEQVLYDLYGLKLGVSAWEVQEHGCPHEVLERPKTLQLVEKVMILANRMSMKDLLKSDLKTTVDHMQQTIGQLKSTPQMIHNLRTFTEFMKKPIHPLRLYRALSGSVDVDAVSVNVPEAALADHGWFFLLGMIALTKFKGVDLNRRQTPGATDDLRIGATFLRLQLQFTADRWDAWFRLAECFDYELDEAVLWTADKINKDRSELVKFQRNAIHCYTLALSHSVNTNIETYEGDPLHDLYHKFGMRLYASSREPFAMEPFQHSELERYFIENSGQGTFKRIVHTEMSKYKVWKYAARLFKMAMKRQPSNWKNPYMLAKCYWKMYMTPEADLDRKDMESRVELKTLVDTLKKSVDVAYNASRSRRSEPILEPHYKIVSILHKLVLKGDIPSKDAAAILSDRPLGVALDPEDHFASFAEPEDWEEYIIRNLTKLREKDKSNWQHRIIMRHANILFHDASAEESDADPTVAAKAAFQILRESMFTKTMVMNVWKCDAERPGRHHVYTTLYTRFMTRLLVLMSDRTNMEQLLRRLRKKGADFYHFNDLWQTCCLAYVKLLRSTYNIKVATDEPFKTMSTFEFEIMTNRITEWAASEGPHTCAFSCMRDAIELKKLNASLTRAGPIDDLINDCYSQIFIEVTPSLPGLDPAKILAEQEQAKEADVPKVDGKEAGEAAETAESKLLHPVHRGVETLNGLLNPPEGNVSSRAATPTPQDSEKPESGTARVRKPGIRRPEVLRKAEAAVLRSMEPKVGGTKSRVGSISSKRGSQTPVAAMTEDEDSDEGPDAQVLREAEAGMNAEMKDTDGEGETRTAASDIDSLGNDGDDESDLSDVPEGYDEEMPPGLMFPNLRRADTASESSGEEADSESEGDGEESAQDEEEVEAEAEAEEAGEHEPEEEEEEEEEHEAGEGETEIKDDDGDMEMAEAGASETDEDEKPATDEVA